MRTDPSRKILENDSIVLAPHELISAIQERAFELGLADGLPFSAALLQPNDRIRSFCRDNRCGRFGRHHMCPEAIGSVEDCAARLAGFENGILFQSVYEMDVRGNRKALVNSKVDFHLKILKLEATLRQSSPNAWGLIGGDCALCDPCFAVHSAPCAHPDRARPSLESMAVNVMALLAALGLDTGFHADRVTWTGCLLY